MSDRLEYSPSDNVPHVVLLGDVRVGVQRAVGPFASEQEAEEWLGAHNGCTVPLLPPTTHIL